MDETSQINEGQINEQGHVGTLPVEFNSNNFVQNFEEISLLEKEQKASASLPGSPTLALDGIIRPIRSQGGMPILGSEEIILPKWKFDPPTPVQGLSPNSTAITLLAGFTQGNIQMQGNAIKHLQEGNLAKLQQVTIELLEPGMGRVVGSIPVVNFVGGMNQVPVEESIGEMLSKLGNKNSTSSEQNNEIDFDDDCYSLGKEKQGNLNPIQLPVTKVADKRKEKEKQKQKEDKGKDKPKPPPKSALGPIPPRALLLSTTKLTTRQSPRKRSATQSPEGALLHSNLRINPTTGVPYTAEAERRAIKEILNKRHKRPLEEEDEEVEEMVPKKKKSPPRRTSRDLIAKMKTTGGHKSEEEIQKRGKTYVKRQEDITEESALQARLWPKICREGQLLWIACYWRVPAWPGVLLYRCQGLNF